MKTRPVRWLRVGARRWALVGLVGVAMLRSLLPAFPDVIRDLDDREPILVAIYEDDPPDDGDRSYEFTEPTAISPAASGVVSANTLEEVVRWVNANYNGRAIRFADSVFVVAPSVAMPASSLIMGDAWGILPPSPQLPLTTYGMVWYGLVKLR